MTAASFSISLLFIIDKVGVSFLFVVGLISGSVFIFATQYIINDKFYWRFIWILLGFVISIGLLVISGRVFMLLLG